MAKKKSTYREKKEAQGEHFSVADIQPLNTKQDLYMQMLKTHQLVIAHGDSGSGKTFIASWWAAKEYMDNQIEKIIITRPYVQMGKDAGAIPGTDYEKLEPYLRPILNNLKKFLGAPKFEMMLKRGDIEVYVTEKIRGMSFDENCIVIGDEMQNATADQIKAITTRIGEGCQMVLCGDPNQHDLKVGTPGIEYLAKVKNYCDIDGIGLITFDKEDCVRSGLAKDLLFGFAKYDKESRV